MMSSNYRKSVLPTTEEIERYQYEEEAADDRFRQFLQMLRLGTSAGTAELARILGVTRMTVYSWAARIRKNQPLKNRGRERKYRGQASVPICVRIPRGAAQAILGQYDAGSPVQKTLLRQACERILAREFGLNG